MQARKKMSLSAPAGTLFRPVTSSFEKLPEEFKAFIADHIRQLPDDVAYTAAFLRPIIGAIGIASLYECSPSLVLLAMVSLCATPAAADWVFNKGIPSGGRDLCKELINCEQGYLSDGSSTMQVDKTFVDATGKGAFGAVEQLKGCLTIDKVGQALSSSLPGIFNASFVSDCTATSSQFLGYQASSVVTKLPTTLCATYQNNFESATQSCMITGRANGLTAALSIGILAGFGLLTGIIFLSVYCCVGRQPPKCCKR